MAFADYDRPAVTVDLVLMTVVAEALMALVMRRESERQAGVWALPGGFVGIDEALEAAAERLLRDKARLPGGFVEQLYTFGAVDRDPRGRVISVAYYALVAEERLTAALNEGPDLMLVRLDVPWSGETGGPVFAIWPDHRRRPLAFDHEEILGLAVKRLRGKLDYTAVGLELLPDLFPLRRLQSVHEAILGRPLIKPAFRRKMLDRGYVEATGQREAAAAFRPAELYRRANFQTDQGSKDHG
jgi:8-oxo-dGTP diphosphatase